MQEKKEPNENLEFNAKVKLSELTDEEDEYVYVNITVEDESEDEDTDKVEGVPVPLVAVDPDSVELDEAFRDGENYIARLTATKTEPANATQEQLDEIEGSRLLLTVTVGTFESRYTPQMDEGVLGFVVEAIRRLQGQDAGEAQNANVTGTEKQR